MGGGRSRAQSGRGLRLASLSICNSDSCRFLFRFHSCALCSTIKLVCCYHLQLPMPALIWHQCNASGNVEHYMFFCKKVTAVETTIVFSKSHRLLDVSMLCTWPQNTRSEVYEVVRLPVMPSKAQIDAFSLSLSTMPFLKFSQFCVH